VLLHRLLIQNSSPIYWHLSRYSPYVYKASGKQDN
jgi:hypothetical protein